MRALVILALAACTPSIVYVVAPASAPAGTCERAADAPSSLGAFAATDDLEHAPVSQCESPDEMPTVNCVGGVMRFDGCRWGCGPWFSVETRQSKCGPIVVNGFQVTECEE